jgi:hypothetical protein
MSDPKLNQLRPGSGDLTTWRITCSASQRLGLAYKIRWVEETPMVVLPYEVFGAGHQSGLHGSHLCKPINDPAGGKALRLLSHLQVAYR